MNSGDTFFGLDRVGHLWIVLTTETLSGQVAVANLTTHDPEQRRSCDDECVIVRPGEHPYPRHDSCVFYRDAFLTSFDVLRRGLENRSYMPGDPLTPQLLERVRHGALASPLTDRSVEAAIRRDLQQR